MKIYEFIHIFSYAVVWFYCHSDGTEDLCFIKCGEFLDCLRNLDFQNGLDSRKLVSLFVCSELGR